MPLHDTTGRTGTQEDGWEVCGGLGADHRQLLIDSAISPDVASSRGYHTETNRHTLRELGYSQEQSRGGGGLLIPIHTHDGYVAFQQLRPDTPRQDRRYELPPGRGTVIDVHPHIRQQVADPTVDLLITEGVRKADSANSLGLCCIALLSVWAFTAKGAYGESEPLEDWEHIPLEGRTVYVCFDSDVATKPEVGKALRKFTKFLRDRGATVKIIYLPHQADGSKQGLDDFFAAGGTVEELYALASDEVRGAGGRQSQASILREIGEQQSQALFHDEQGQPYAAINRGDHCETFRIDSSAFREYLTDQYMRANDGAVPGKQAIEEAVWAVKAIATIRGPEQAVYLRVGERDGDIWIDLGGPDWKGICVTASGWGVETLPAGMFRRSKGMGQLPEPESGSLDLLRQYLNVGDGPEGDVLFRHIVAWQIGALKPDGPYPMLALTGPHGSAKSTAARVVRFTIDPHASLLQSPPTSDADVWNKVAHNWVNALDNVSFISPERSDSYCRVSTGGGYSKRKLYSDDDLHQSGGMRPQIITAIGDVISRPDLLDRSVLVHQPPLTAYRTESDLWAGFARDHPGILGALCDGVSAALANLPTTTIAELPRMADFALWIEAASPGIGWEPGAYLTVYNANREEASAIALEGSLIGQAMLGFMKDKTQWNGTAGELLTALEDDLKNWKATKAQGWPRTPKTLSDGLDRIKNNLESIGISFERTRSNGVRKLELRRVAQDG